jgi:type I restriction enzyme S subunit
MEVKPGYKQTEVGVIPDEWEVKNLGAFVSYTNGKAHENNITDSGKFVVVNSKFISTEGDIRKYSNDCFCPTVKGDVLMVMSDVPNGRAIAKCYLVEHDKTYTVNQRICILSPQAINPKLLFYKLDRNPYYLAFDDGAKQTNLRKDDVLTCPLGIPKSDDEQRAIAGALSDMDALLGALDQLIAKKRDLKQAAMQQLLTGQTRLPGFHGEGEVKRLGDCLLSRPDYGINAAAVHYSDKLPSYIRITDISEHGRFCPDPRVSVKAANADQYYLHEGDVVFARTGASVGKSYLYDTRDGELVFAGFLIRVRPNPEILVPAFLAAYATTKAYWNWVRLMSMRSGQPGINGNEYAQLPLSLPSVPEQIAIAEVLTDMDAELAALEQRRAKTRALKQGMMQELLTGRTRLVES